MTILQFGSLTGKKGRATEFFHRIFLPVNRRFPSAFRTVHSGDARLRLAALLLCLSFSCRVLAAPLQTYSPPANPREDVLLNAEWRFIRQDVEAGQSPTLDDSNWSAVNLPHTWNALDGQDGGNDYYRGPSWYRRHLFVDARSTNRCVFLKFDGAFVVTDVWVNDHHAGQHQGGFAAFVFDVTPFLRFGADNLIAVRVSNAPAPDVPPLSADFTFFGGLYRDVHLLVTDPVHISPLDYGSPGVYLQTFNVSSNSAELRVTTVVSNAAITDRPVTLCAVVTDAQTNIVATLTTQATLPASTTSNLLATTKVPSPHLWDAQRDPYLYRVFVQIQNDGRVSDLVNQPLGFRSFRIDPDQGFFLNGHYLDLHGVSMHQDWISKGWALGEAERLANFAVLKEIGATALRLSHYEHTDQTYQLADQNGIILWSEIPVINRITDSPAFYSNAEQQLRELIRQRYNHPSVVCWGLFNEITLKPGPKPSALVKRLAKVAAEEDPTRPSTAAANTSDDDPSSWFSDVVAFNKYFGWYNGKYTEFGAWADQIHAKRASRCVGVGEYGAGASAWQHSENPIKPNPDGHFHPEEYQDVLHESLWQQMKARPYLWCKFVWNLFEFAADSRDEGDTPGRNDKGLVTYDRQIRKDAFYWYKANWNAEPMVYITGHTFTNRLTNSINAKVYANCDSVELFLNGNAQGTRKSTNCIFSWPLLLHPGANSVNVVGSKGGIRVTDSLVWNAPAQLPGIGSASPTTVVTSAPPSSARLVFPAATNHTGLWPNPGGTITKDDKLN
jgi:beta-galactosidase